MAIGRTNVGGGGGGDKSTIYVTVDAGSVVTCTKGSVVKTKTATDGTCKFTGLDLGTWNLKATKSGLTATASKTFTRQEIAYITMSYFTATIKTTFPEDATSVTCVNGSTTLSVPSGSLKSGSYTFTVHNSGTWRVTASKTGMSKYSDVTVSNNGDVKTVKLYFILYLYNAGNQYTDITGGWKAVNNGSGRCSIESDHLYINYKNDTSYSRDGSIFTTKKFLAIAIQS